MDERYAKIINLPHHVSTRRPPMTLNSRAAQFAPFAALSGYNDDIDDTAREAADGFSDGIYYAECEKPADDDDK
ncbi:hypothetical protein J6Z39_00990 [bacterium]|nr:hypothetical protein [bacterium]MBP5434374.1 hypothetical protein [bacterium]